MSAGSRLARKSGWLIGGRSLADALSFLFYLLLARTFGADGIGAYAFAFAVAAIAGLAVGLGLRHLLTREAARDPGFVRRSVASVTVVQTGAAALVAAGLWFGAPLFGVPADTRVLLMLAFAGVALQEIAGTFLAYVESAEAMEASAALEVGSRGIQFLAGVGLILAGAGLATVMTAHVAAGLAYVIGAAWSTRRLFGHLRPRVDPGLAFRQAYAALPFLASGVLYTLYARVDIVMLHHFSGEVATGLYSVAYKLVTTPLFVAFLIGLAVYPALSRSAEDRERRDALFLGSLRWTAVLGAAGAVLLATTGDRFLVTIFGPQFEAAGAIARWMAALFLAEFVAVPYWRFLYAVDRERQVLALRAAALALNVALNLVLIPRWGPLGAVWASIASEGGLVVGLHLACARHVSAPYGSAAARLLVAGTASLVAGSLLRPFLPWPVVAGLVSTCLLATAWALGLARPSDVRVIRGALGKAAG